ncbi:oxalate:formate antiporter-like isoform X1 [Brachionus plicatilis]|uniref:Oxalate:formate antiporter-like isoform X1 n=1 Tax=Brachionus plicatilis TaxID=10195 RepID=A0A3M7RNJ8_BRAPC|nr:oxalate:formate antiporter-like isoform X1 [Brachionus plicatilis]
MIDRLIPEKYKKWSTLLGGFLLQLSIGSFLTFGNLVPYITSYLRINDNLDVRYSETIWIATSYNFAFSLSNLLSGLINTHFNLSPKILILVGTVISTIGVCCTYFSIQKSLYLVILTYGIIFGIGSGLAYVGPLTIAMKWFPRNGGFSNSIILFGYGISSVVFNQVQTIYINPDNMSPDKPFSPSNQDEKYFSNQILLDRIPKVFLLLGTIYTFLQLVGLSLLSRKPETDECHKLLEIKETINYSNKKNSFGISYESTTQGMNLKEAIKRPAFWNLFIILFSQIVPCGLVINFYKTFGQTFLSDDKFLSLVGSFAALLNALSTFFWGFLIEKFPFKICSLFLSTSLVALSSTLYLIQFIGFKYLYAIQIGLVMTCRSGALVLMPTITAKTFGQKNFQSIYGALYMATLLSSFVVGELGSHGHELGWFWLFLTCSLIAFVGWTLGFVFNVKKINGDDI